jgi:formylglycine-generating enzyme required for sulfatase activity
MSEITNEIIAKNKVERFVSRFEDSYYFLACHVAVPLALTPELVNYLRIEFLRNERVPWIAEADLLLSDLCKQVGYELYVMDKDVRAYLLKILAGDSRFGEKRIREICRLLLSYIKYLEKTNSFIEKKDLQYQRWGAMLYLDTEETVRQIAKSISECLHPGELARLLKITEDFKEKISSSGEFQVFLDYAQICNDLLREPEKVKPEKIKDLYSVGEVELTIPKIVISDKLEQVFSEELEKGKLFYFEVVKVNESGEIISRNQESARQKIEDLGDGIELEMVYIPGGTFMMGSPENEEERRDDEGPQHNVTVSPFFMGKYPVTQGQWRAIASQTNLKVKLDLNPEPSEFTESYQDIDRWQRPVEKVKLIEAVEFCERLSKLTGKDYRLPSESEWEYACRAGTTTPFYFGETITPELVNYNGEYTYGKSSKGEYRKETTPVGQFLPNAFGLYNMHGNVSEFCQDVYNENYNEAPTDGSAWEIEGDSYRNLGVCRGGSWYLNPGWCRSANRIFCVSDETDFNNIGFRLVSFPPRTLE